MQQLIERNIAGAIEIKEGILEQLERALDKETAAYDMLRSRQDTTNGRGKSGANGRRERVRGAGGEIRSAMAYERVAEKLVDGSIYKLDKALEDLGSE